MKNALVRIALTGILAGSLLPGCGKTSDQKVGSAERALAVAMQESKDKLDNFRMEWQSFKRETDVQIEANGRMIDTLKVRIDKAGKKGNTEVSKDMAMLEQKNRDLKAKVGGYKDRGQASWKLFKTDVRQDLEGVRHAMKDLYKKIG